MKEASHQNVGVTQITVRTAAGIASMRHDDVTFPASRGECLHTAKRSFDDWGSFDSAWTPLFADLMLRSGWQSGWDGSDSHTSLHLPVLPFPPAGL